MIFSPLIHLDFFSAQRNKGPSSRKIHRSIRGLIHSGGLFIMNVYSVRLLPSLKIKLCQFLGIATSMAVEELGLRLESLER